MKIDLMKFVFWVCGGWCFLVSTPLAQTSPSLPLVELVRPGPWAGVSQLIIYGPRIYFVNSQVYTNHNSADIYSFHLTERAARFEHRLFSQDAGEPAVINGLLVWPSEDARFSASISESTITNGQDWQWRVHPDVPGFHLHAIGAHNGTQYAMASAWKGRIFQSTNGGQSWELLFEQPTPSGQVSRVTSWEMMKNTPYFALNSREFTSKLLRYQAGKVEPVLGWPPGQAVEAMQAFRGKLYAVHRTIRKIELWTIDGQEPAQLVRGLPQVRVLDIDASESHLWIVGKDRDGGVLMNSPDGETWKVVQRFTDEPISILVWQGQPFVGTYNIQQGGALWGPAKALPVNSIALSEPRALPHQAMKAVDAPDIEALLQEIDEMTPSQASQWSRSAWVKRLVSLAQSRDPKVGSAFSQRLRQPFPEVELPVFGPIRVSAQRLLQWYLLYGISINGHGRVPVELLTQPWQSPTNRAEKYLEPSVAAAWAVIQTGQNDEATVKALQEALQNPMPRWVRGDFMAALHELSVQPFSAQGYNL